MNEKKGRYTLTARGWVAVTSVFWIVALCVVIFAISRLSTPVSVDTPRDAVELSAQNAESIVFSVLFNPEETVINRRDYEILDNITKFAKQNSNLTLYIEGFAPLTVDPDHDAALARGRAKAAYEYLIHQGVSAEQIIISSHTGDASLTSDKSNRAYLYYK